jgi:hypothetical protein
MKNKNDLNDIILTFTNTGKLPTKYITCTKCSAEVTAFGTNLEGKIKKFGTLVNLLTSFECRKCTSASKPAKPVKEKKARKIKLHKKINEEGEVVYSIPTLKPYVSREVFLKDAPDLIASMTQSTCVNPTLYLDNARNCNGCAFWTHCQCKLRTENEFAYAS